MTPPNITEPLVNKRLSKQAGAAGRKSGNGSVNSVDLLRRGRISPISDKTEEFMIKAVMPTGETNFHSFTLMNRK